MKDTYLQSSDNLLRVFHWLLFCFSAENKIHIDTMKKVKFLCVSSLKGCHKVPPVKKGLMSVAIYYPTSFAVSHL